MIRVPGVGSIQISPVVCVKFCKEV
jgi:hypothetical protein